MKNVINQSAQLTPVAAHNPQTVFLPLEQVTRPTVPTDAAAYYLNRKNQTLRAWACLENGPIRPIRINGRLAWNVAEIKALLSGVETWAQSRIQDRDEALEMDISSKAVITATINNHK